IDSVAWLKAMAWDLRGNYDEELERAVAYGVTPDVGLVEQIFPRYEAEENLPILDSEEWLEHRTAAAAAADVDEAETAAATVHLGATEGQGTGDPAPALDDDGLQDALASAAKALDAVPHTVAEGEGTGSNSWVVSGEHTESGLPLLANDPHLGLAAPSIWSQVGLHCEQVGQACPFDVSGFSFAGFPGVIIGHNGDLAWGLTNLGADVTDFFVEAVRGDEYRYDGVLEPLEVRTETIEVNGADPVTIQVRSTRNGPIISGELSETVGALRTPLGDDGRGGEFAVSLGWTALTPGRSADAIFELNLAKDAADVASAAALFEVPSQNIVFATADGHIGYQAPGRVPVRARVDGDVPSDGSWPRPGWSSDYAWQGYVDSADMPAILDPAEGFIVAANQAVVDEGGGPFLTRDWDYGYRSQRIRSLITGQIESGSPITVESMAAMQSDDWSPFAAHLVPVLLEQQLDDDFAADGQALLEDWDYTTGTDSSAAAYLNAVWANLLQDTFWDDLPQTAWPDGGSRWLSVVSTLLDDPTSPWWDDRTTVNVVETRDEILISALVDARAELTTSLGKDAADWRWGRLHLLSLEHIVLGGPDVPSVVRHFVNPDPVEMPGGSSIVNATSWDAAALDGERRSFAVTSGPSMRMVVDLADPDASRWVVVTGVSGHPGHPHYADQTAAWSVGESFAWLFSDAAVARGAKDTLVLRPGTGS
ncbi:MAG: penicillin acylase family protein, partial [Cellulomonadaceae bacterium]